MPSDKNAAELLKASEMWIDWVLSSPNASEWVRNAVRTAMHRDPVQVLNELEMLNILLRSRCESLIELSVSTSSAEKVVENDQNNVRRL